MDESDCELASLLSRTRAARSEYVKGFATSRRPLLVIPYRNYRFAKAFWRGEIDVNDKAISVRVMELRITNGREQRLAHYKLELIRYQELAADLARHGQIEKARQARSKLMELLFKIDCLEEASELAA